MLVLHTKYYLNFAMKKLLLILTITTATISLPAQTLAWTTWAAYDSTNNIDLYWSFTADSALYSPNNITWAAAGGYTHIANVYRMVDNPVQGCPITDTGYYSTVFSVDTMWMNLIYDSCTGRMDYLTTHYFVRMLTGVENPVSQAEFKIFPNPSDGYYSIQTETAFAEIIITDIAGRIIETKRSGNSENAELDLFSYPNGTYFVTIVFEDHVATQRIVKGL